MYCMCKLPQQAMSTSGASEAYVAFAADREQIVRRVVWGEVLFMYGIVGAALLCIVLATVCCMACGRKRLAPGVSSSTRESPANRRADTDRLFESRAAARYLPHGFAPHLLASGSTSATACLTRHDGAREIQHEMAGHQEAATREQATLTQATLTQATLTQATLTQATLTPPDAQRLQDQLLVRVDAALHASCRLRLRVRGLLITLGSTLALVGLGQLLLQLLC
jgi:hypothetical protein